MLNLRIFALFIFITGTLWSCKKTQPPAAYGTLGHERQIKELVQNALRAKRPLTVNSTVNLQGQRLDIGNLELRFENGGQLQNGTLVGKRAKHVSTLKQCYQNIQIQGDWDVKTAYLEWFVPNVPNAQQNFQALCNAIEIGEAVQLRAMYPIALPQPTHCYTTRKTIHLKGENNQQNGLILETKQPSPFYAYFRNDTGNSLMLDRVTIQTRDYLDGKYSNAETDYCFSGTYYQKQFNPGAKPHIEQILLTQCIFNGAMALSANGASSENQSPSDFQKKNSLVACTVSDCMFNYCNAPLSFSNMGFGAVQIRNNHVRNFSSSFLNFAASGLSDAYYPILEQCRGQVVFEGNIFENERPIVVPKGRAMTPCVVKGGNGSLLFKNNKLLGLRTTTTDGEVYTWYYTCTPLGKCEVIGNQFQDCVARGSSELPAALVKERGAANLFIENNTFSISIQALVDVGVLKKGQTDPSLCQKNEFYCDFIQMGGQVDFDKTCYIRNNRFSMPYCNLSTQIMSMTDWAMEGNRIEIGYFGTVNTESTVTKNGVFLLGRQRMERKRTHPQGSFLCKNNTIKIGGAAVPVWYFIQFPDGVQSGTGQATDRVYNYKTADFSDQIEANHLCVAFQLPDAETVNIATQVNGRQDAISVEDHANANHRRPNTKQLHTQLKVAQYQSVKDQPGFVLLPGAQQTLEAQAHDGSDIEVLNFSYLNSLYPLQDHLPMAVDIQLTYWDKANKAYENNYTLVLSKQDRSVWHKSKNRSIEGYDPSTPATQEKTIEGTGADPNGVVLSMLPGDRHLRNASVRFQNTKAVARFLVNVQCHPVTVAAETPVEYREVVKRRAAAVTKKAN